MIKKVFPLSLSMAFLVLAASCSFFSVKGDTGFISINLGSTGSRSYDGSPMPMPVFSSATISISGPGMAAQTLTLSPSELAMPQSIEVPAGPNRRIQVLATVDWEATETYFSELEYPYPGPSLATAYGARALVEVKPETSTQVNLSFSLTQTRILLPSYNYTPVVSNLKTLDSFNGTPEAATENFEDEIAHNTQFCFNRYGGLYYTNEYYIRYAFNSQDLFGEVNDTNGDVYPINLYIDPNESEISNFTYDIKNNRLYVLQFSYDFGTYILCFVDLNDIDEEMGPAVVSLGALESFKLGPESKMEVDSEGFLYTIAYTEIQQEAGGETWMEFDSYHLLKLEISGETVQVLESRDFESLGFTKEVIDRSTTIEGGETSVSEFPRMFFDVVTDMFIMDSQLYVAADRDIDWNYDIFNYDEGTNDYNKFYAKTGMIAELRLSDLAVLRSFGGGEATATEETSTRLFGPTRFLGFGPRRLYFSDEAFCLIPVGEDGATEYRTMNRLAELNLDTGEIQVRVFDESVTDPVYFFGPVIH